MDTGICSPVTKVLHTRSHPLTYIRSKSYAKPCVPRVCTAHERAGAVATETLTRQTERCITT